MGKFTDSIGRKFTKQQIDRRVNDAKKQRMYMQLDDYGFNFCEDCKRNDCKPIDASHNISVDRCQKDPAIPLELAWDISNIKPRGRPCHRKHDKL
jgi:hypothetical protein